MALLVDGNCSVQEKERGWAHLSDCQECYDQWYVLKMEEREGRKEGGIVHLMRPKTFAVVGSTLAVAASIAVFLNIPQAPFPDHLAEDSVQSQQVVKKTDTSLSQVVEPEVAAEYCGNSGRTTIRAGLAWRSRSRPSAMEGEP